MHHYYRLNPHQPNTQSNNFAPRGTVTYTDQRIDQIKKKYDTPNKKQAQTNKENVFDYRSKKHCLTEARDKGDLQIRNQYSSIGNCLRQRKNVQISKFGLGNEGQVSKPSVFSNVQDLHIKPSINSKLNATQTEHHFYKLKTQPSSDAIIFMRNKQSNPKLNRREYFDPRIQSIDKINSKIKRILDCIDDCQKEEVRHSGLRRSREQRGKNVKNSILGMSINSNNEPFQNQLQQTTIIERRTIVYGNKEERQATNASKDSQIHAIPSLSEMRANYSNNQFSHYLNSYKNHLKQKENQTYTCPNTHKQKSVPKLTTYFEQLKKSYKKDAGQEDNSKPKMDQINQQINKFQQKIVELQQQKRKLNIRFKPFYYQASPINKLNATNQKETSHKYDCSIQKLKNQLAAKQLQIYHEPITLAKQPPREFNYEEQLTQQKQDEQKIYDNYQLRKKIEERMEERRKKIEMLHQTKKVDHEQITSLILALCQQVKLDQNLRSAKNWFSESNHHQTTNNLHDLLRSKGLNLSKEQVESEFQQLHQDQSDPFFSFREQKYTIQSMVDYYIRCNKHWNEKIAHKWDRRKLSEQNFEANFFNQHDILIEDLVRLLNTQTGSFYRNRDLYLIYLRLTKELKKKEGESMSVNSLIEVFS